MIPVVIATNGRGIPVRAIEGNAPVMQVAGNGRGIPIVLSDLGAPFIVQGLGPDPEPGEWDVTATENEIIINAMPTPEALEASGGAGQIVIGA